MTFQRGVAHLFDAILMSLLMGSTRAPSVRAPQKGMTENGWI
ncbi:hypothetical protein V5S80_01825 [Corynebacterium kroppenstedtii]